jgi:hypothetical protein
MAMPTKLLRKVHAAASEKQLCGCSSELPSVPHAGAAGFIFVKLAYIASNNMKLRL